MSQRESLSRPAYEAKDAEIGVLAATAAALVAIVAASILVAIVLRLRVGRGRTPVFHPAPAELFQNGPESRTSIEVSWTEIESSVHKNLDEYGWVDRAAGVAHIPIDRAMELVVREGEAAPASSRKAGP